MWIFGYGSLVWKADFPYAKKIIGYIKGYERKFWQASIDHRGVPEKPGRVVTLIPSDDPEAKVWGAAYKIHPKDVEHVVQHLDMREVMGYEKTPVEFFPLPNHSLNMFDALSCSSTSIISSSVSNSSMNGHTVRVNGRSNGVSGSPVNGHTENGGSANGVTNEKVSNGVHENGASNNDPSKPNGAAYPQSSSTESEPQDQDQEDYINDILDGRKIGSFLVTMYYGNSENPHFVGPAPTEQMAHQIFESAGPSGTNKDYLYNLADAMRQICEEANDSHLAELEMKVRKLEISMNKKKSGRSTPIEL